MIQRKQSIFLVLAVTALGAMFFFPLARFIGEADSLVFYLFKTESLVPDGIPELSQYFNLTLLTLVVFTIILSIITLFLYKNRKLQMNLVKVSILFVMLAIGMFFFYYVPALEAATGGLAEYDFASYFPIIAFLFYMLAFRGIMSDEKLIRSADRLR